MDARQSRRSSFRYTAPADPTVRTLFHQILRATVALDAALDSSGADPEALAEAREALEAFDLLERSSTDFVVPRKVRRRLKEAAHYLDTDHLELARADLGRAGSELERSVGRPSA